MIQLTQEQRELIIQKAQSLIGVPFQHAGRNEFGLDCIGLLTYATRLAGLPVYDNISYSPVVNAEYLEDELSHAAVRLPSGTPVQLADVMLFRVGTSPQHTAFVSQISGNRIMMLHSYQTVGRVVEHWMDETWRRRWVSTWSWRPS